jgi:Dyp-type peroxidase family
VSVPLEPILEIQEIQGNILAGFNKDYQRLVFLSIEDIASAKKWLRGVQGHISSTTEVHYFNRLFRSLRLRMRREPPGLAATWCNLHFSHGGITKLTSSKEADALPDTAFRIGMPARAVAILGDPKDAASPYSPKNWKIGGSGNVPDILLIVASDQAHMAEKMVQMLLQAQGVDGLRVLGIEIGETRSDLPGHEHFGFKDGISQPGVRGRTGNGPEEFITPRLIDPSDPLSESYSRPGQPLIMPGHFVLGYETQSPADGSPQPAAPLAFDWFRNGSFLVYRRLRQDVAAFRDFVRKTAANVAAQSGFEYVNCDLMASVMVGRWPNGAAITRSPDRPNDQMANYIAANAFAFSNNMNPVKMRPGVTGDATPPAPGDPLALVCPHWAHIRKVNPRDESTDLGDGFDPITRHMIRRGIPYGKPLPHDSPDDGEDRGLLFLAYQASLEQSFEKVTSDWTNQTQNPSPEGHDPVIGQTNANGSRTRRVVLPNRQNSAVSCPVAIDREWVFPTGGGYFFSPSLSAIAGRLAN